MNPTADSGTLGPSTRPLNGLVVIDLTIALAGPYATFLLAALGARVIKVENPDNADPCRRNSPYVGPDGATLGRRDARDVSVSALNRLRGKEAVTLNLKRPGGREVLFDLVRRADILVENFSAGTLDRLDAGHAQLSVINPRLIYCTITGFGADDRRGKALDTIVQALSGLMMTSGLPGEPPVRVGVPFADMVAPLFGVIGVLAALQQREQTGRGQHVDISMLGALTSMVAAEPFDLLEQCGIPTRTGRMVPRLAPFGVYRTLDGFVAICAPTEEFAKGVFEAIQQPELGSDMRFATRDARVVHVDALNDAIEAFTRRFPSSWVVARFEQCEVPAAQVRSPIDAVSDPRVRSRLETVSLPHAHPDAGEVIGMGLPIVFSEASNDTAMPAPGLGEHNERIYGQWLGYSAGKLTSLRADGVI